MYVFSLVLGPQLLTFNDPEFMLSVSVTPDLVHSIRPEPGCLLRLLVIGSDIGFRCSLFSHFCTDFMYASALQIAVLHVITREANESVDDLAVRVSQNALPSPDGPPNMDTFGEPCQIGDGDSQVSGFCNIGTAGSFGSKQVTCNSVPSIITHHPTNCARALDSISCWLQTVSLYSPLWIFLP